MKKRFEGQISDEIPPRWDSLTQANPLMRSGLLEILKVANPDRFSMVTHADYCCCEYENRMNLLTFSKFRFDLKLHVIDLPVSLCAPGYTGDLQAMIKDYKQRKGLFLILNIEDEPELAEAATGETLGNCIFENRFASFEEYLFAMKSSYRRRIKIALQKAEGLHWEAVVGQDFTDEMHQLYQKVFERSKYPLENLKVDFFRLFPGELFCLFKENMPLAFVLLKEEGRSLSFIFGGMDYELRDTYDLYMNMLIFLIRQCIERGCLIADLGQTAEHSKLRMGATYSPRYLCIFSGNPLFDAFLKRAVGMFSYHFDRQSYAMWRKTHE